MNDNTEQVKKLSIGEERVRVAFNPSDSSDVYLTKEASAKWINRLEDLKEEDGVAVHREKIRLLALAQTDIESACMWAVKALTHNI